MVSRPLAYGILELTGYSERICHGDRKFVWALDRWHTGVGIDEEGHVPRIHIVNCMSCVANF